MNYYHTGGNWPKLCSRLLEQLNALQYMESTIINYRKALKRIETYMAAHNVLNYSEEVGAQYTKEWKKINPAPDSERFILIIIRRLNDILTDVDYVFHHSSSTQRCPENFSEQADRFIEHLRVQGKRKSTIDLYRRYCLQFLCSLESAGVTSIAKVQPKHIYDAFSASNSKINFSKVVPSFLRFLYKKRIHDIDLSFFVPKPRSPQLVPSTYSEEEMIRLVASVDRTTAIGKRDYAILTIALQLGLRTSDICNLSFENIDYQRETINLSQCKTGVPLRIALLSDVEEALDAYLQSGRPASDSTIIFLSSLAPFTPLHPKSTHNITRKYFKAAQIDTKGKKHGTHALRMSLATELMSEDIPYSVIQKILGQEDPNSTKHYVKIDVEKLRSCALEVPSPTGLFAKRLGVSKGGGQ